MVIPYEYVDKLYRNSIEENSRVENSIETRIIVLPDAENPTIVSFIRLDKTSGCDGRTDGENSSDYYRCLHCKNADVL